MKLPSIILLLCVCFVDHSLCKKSIPSFVKICKRSDPQLDNCIVNTIKEMKPYLPNGIPEMKISPFDPFKVQKITLDAGLNVKLTGTEVEMRNLLEFDINHFHFDLQKLQIELDIHFPKVYFSGIYALKGHLLMFDLNGSGLATVNATNNDVSIKVKGEKVMKNGKEYLHFNDYELHAKVEDIRAYFEDLFKGNEELTANTNKVLNENAKDLLPDYLPIIEDTLKGIVMSVVQNAFDSFPLEELLPE